MISKFFLCTGVASVNRHDQTNGTLIVRPSIKWAMIESSVTSIFLILVSSLTTVFMPGLNYLVMVSINQGTDSIQLRRRIAIVLTESRRVKPEFTDHSLALHMDVNRLSAIKTVEV